jgi:hypothetical protein
LVFVQGGAVHRVMPTLKHSVLGLIGLKKPVQVIRLNQKARKLRPNEYFAQPAL